MRVSLIVAMLVLTCVSGNTRADDTIELNGSGQGWFTYPLMEKLTAEYGKLHPNVKITHIAVGERGEVRMLSKQTVDFAQSDVPWTDAMLKKAEGGDIIHIPMALGAIVPVYQLSEVPTDKPLVFSGPVLADIFRGTITRWNDPTILKLNDGVKLPDREISVVHRADGCVTSFLFTDYLSSASPDFAKGPGRGNSVNWLVGIGRKGPDGIQATIKQTNGSIGYVEFQFAKSNKVVYGNVINSDGKAVRASVESLTAAAEGLKELPADLRMFNLNGRGESAYPISSFCYLLVYKKQTDPKKGKPLAEFLKWVVADGQRIGAELGYAPIPENVVKADLQLIDSMIVP